MTCEELRPGYLLYAMGTVGEPESSELRVHLDRGCAACTEGLRQAHALVYSMGAVLAGPEAPRELRGRVLGISGVEARRTQAPGPLLPRARSGRLWQGWALAAAAIVLAVIPASLWHRQLSQARASQAAVAELLAEERRASSSLRAESRGAVPIFALEVERGGTAGEALKQLAIPAGVRAVVLALPADLVRQASAVELRNATGETIWTASSLPDGDADSTGLKVDGRLLTPGRYAVVLLAGGRTLARLPFAVIPR